MSKYFDNKFQAHKLVNYITDMMTDEEKLKFKTTVSASGKKKNFTDKLYQMIEDSTIKSNIINHILTDIEFDNNKLNNDNIEESLNEIMTIFPEDISEFESYIISEMKSRIRSKVVDVWTFEQTENEDVIEEMVDVPESDTEDTTETESGEDTIDSLVDSIVEDMEELTEEDDSFLEEKNEDCKELMDECDNEYNNSGKIFVSLDEYINSGNIVLPLDESAHTFIYPPTKVDDDTHNVESSNIITYDTIIHHNERPFKVFGKGLIDSLIDKKHTKISGYINAEMISSIHEGNKTIMKMNAPINDKILRYQRYIVTENSDVRWVTLSPLIYGDNGHTIEHVLNELYTEFPGGEVVLYEQIIKEYLGYDIIEITFYYKDIYGNIKSSNQFNSDSFIYVDFIDCNSREDVYAKLDELYPEYKNEDVKIAHASLRSLIYNEMCTTIQVEEEARIYIEKLKKIKRNNLDNSIYV